MEKKRRHHYVWRKYLRAWATDGKIFCCMNGTIFNPSLRDIAVRRDFYKVIELSSEEIEFIQHFIKHTDPILQNSHNRWIELLQLGFKFRKQLQVSGLLQPDIEKQVDNFIRNQEENWHTYIETKAIALLNSILNGDTSFYSSEQGFIEFTFYLCEQYVRTSKMKSNVLSNFDVLQSTGSIPASFNFERLWNVISHIMATSIGYDLYKRSASIKMVLLDRQGSKEFITGDQPVINTFAIGLPMDQAPSELEFYYPVSPELAILITDRSPNDARSLSDHEVDHFNRMIVDQSETHIYGASEETLNDYLIGNQSSLCGSCQPE